MEDQSLIAETLIKYFYHKWQPQEVNLLRWLEHRINHYINGNLHGCMEAKISDDEIWLAVKEMRSNWALGIDGITTSFYKNFRNIVGGTVSEAI